MSHVKFMSRSNAAEGTDIYFFFFSNQVSESLANTQSHSLPTPSAFFSRVVWFWFLGFFFPQEKKSNSPRFDRGFSEAAEPPEPRPGGRSDPLPAPATLSCPIAIK